GQVQSVAQPYGRGGGGGQNRPVAFEGQGLQLFAFGNAYDVETYGGIAVPNKNMTIIIGKGTFTSKGEELPSNFMDVRTLTVNNLQSLLIYKGDDIEIEPGARVPDGRGGFTIASTRFTIKSGMPVPRAWLESPQFSHLLKGKVYEQKYLVGKV